MDLISSRTPEGTPNHCPVCNSSICIEPSALVGDAPCPVCGCLLWFVTIRDAARFFPAEESQTRRDRVIAILAEQLGVSEEVIRTRSSINLVNDLGADSLDTVELVMALEEEFD